MIQSKLVAQAPERLVKAKNVSVYMTEREHRQLIKLSQRVGMSYSGIVRGLVTAYAAGEVAPKGLPHVEAPVRKAMSPRERVLRAGDRAARRAATGAPVQTKALKP